MDESLRDEFWTLVIDPSTRGPVSSGSIGFKIRQEYMELTCRTNAPLPHYKETLDPLLKGRDEAEIRKSIEFARVHGAVERAEVENRRQREEWERRRVDAEKRAAEDAIRSYAAWPIIPIESAQQSNPPFRYHPADETDLAAAEQALLADYPRLRLDALRLLLAAIGFTRSGIGSEAPQVLLVGTSGAGKTQTTRLAAFLACTEASFCTFGRDPASHIAGYSQAQGVALYDNIDGMAERQQQRLRNGVPIFTRGRVEPLSPVAITSRELIPCFWADTALARRVVLVDLQRGAAGQYWLAHPVEDWRAENADAADVFVSNVIDRFFRRSKIPTFAQIAAELGFAYLTAYREQAVGDFAAALDKPSKASPVKGDGWRVIVRRYGSNPLVERLETMRPLLDECGCEVKQLPKDKRTFVRFPPGLLEQGRGRQIECRRKGNRSKDLRVGKQDILS